MIADKSRAGWFGASDTSKIMGRWDTPTFARFWLEKLGVIENTYINRQMLAGTYYEHRILDALGIKQRDRQIRIPKYRLRVNLDGETDIIHEVKTYGAVFKVTKPYWQQCQVQIFAAKKPCEITAYKLLPEDYKNFFNPIDMKRLSYHPIEYDAEWIDREYLPRIEYLAWCLKRRFTPDANCVRRIYGDH